MAVALCWHGNNVGIELHFTAGLFYKFYKCELGTQQCCGHGGAVRRGRNCWCSQPVLSNFYFRCRMSNVWIQLINKQSGRPAYLKTLHFTQQPVSGPRRGATIKTKSMPAVGFSHRGIVLNLKALRGSEKITQPQVRTSGNCFVFYEIQLSVKGHFLKIQCIQSCVITIREEDKTGWDC